VKCKRKGWWPSRSTSLLEAPHPAFVTLEVFPIHPGGPYWAKKDKGDWVIPRGEFEKDEDPLPMEPLKRKSESGILTEALNGAKVSPLPPPDSRRERSPRRPRRIAGASWAHNPKVGGSKSTPRYHLGFLNPTKPHLSVGFSAC